MGWWRGAWWSTGSGSSLPVRPIPTRSLAARRISTCYSRPSSRCAARNRCRAPLPPIGGQQRGALLRRKVLHGLADGDAGRDGAARQEPAVDDVGLSLARFAEDPADPLADEGLPPL